MAILTPDDSAAMRKTVVLRTNTAMTSIYDTHPNDTFLGYGRTAKVGTFLIKVQDELIKPDMSNKR